MKVQLFLDLDLTVSDAERDALEAAIEHNIRDILDHAIRENRFTAGTSASLTTSDWTLRTLPDVSELVAMAESMGLKPEDLDDLVHDAISARASAINNGGLDDQLAFLVEQCGREQIRAALQGLVSSQSS